MSLFGSLFGKKKKVNLTPDITPMPFGASDYSVPLKQLALSRIRGEGVGFGNDFTERAGNSQAKRMRQDFQDYTSPFLSSQASARGLGRSSLALDQQRRAYGETQSDIDQLMERLYILNKQQEKSDISEGINLATQQQGAEFNQSNQQAAASERLANATVAQQNLQAQNERDAAGRIFQAGGTFIGNGGFGSIGTLLNKIKPGMGNAFTSLDGIGRNVNPTKANILGNDEIESFLQALYAARGGR